MNARDIPIQKLVFSVSIVSPIDKQSNSTLWRLKFFIKSRMEALQESYKCNATNSENDFEKPAPKRRRKNAPTPK